MCEIKRSVHAAVARLFRDDGELLRNNVAEQAITHQLARYLAEEFPHWDVDCEYNRDMDTVKRLKFALVPDGDIAHHAVLPDIIIYRRGTSENLLVVEVKKSTNPEPDDPDIRKLRAFREQLDYQNAVFFRFQAGNGGLEVVCEYWICDA